MTIPTWEEAANAIVMGWAQPIDYHVYENEPIGKNAATFRKTLQDAIDSASKEGVDTRRWVPIGEHERALACIKDLQDMLSTAFKAL